MIALPKISITTEHIAKYTQYYVYTNRLNIFDLYILIKTNHSNKHPTNITSFQSNLL